MSRRLSQLPSPVWIGAHGYVVGTQTGHLVHLTESRLGSRFGPRGAAYSESRRAFHRSLWPFRKPEQRGRPGPEFNH